MWLFCFATECVWLFHSTKCFCASLAWEKRSCRSVSQSRATMKVSESEVWWRVLLEGWGQRWHRHVSLMFAPVPVSSSVQSLLLRQHLHDHPCLRGRLRPGADRGRGREARLHGEPAAGQPQLGWRWERESCSFTRRWLPFVVVMRRWNLRWRFTHLLSKTASAAPC